jgi:hypothetical protein
MTDRATPIRRQQPAILDLEAEVANTLRGDHRTPLPPAPTVSIEDIGRLSAEAVQAQYEHAAQSIESMGAAVKERISKLEAAMHECDADMKMIAETAAAVREKGKLIFAQIEEANSVSKDIRAACTEFKSKVVKV